MNRLLADGFRLMVLAAVIGVAGIIAGPPPGWVQDIGETFAWLAMGCLGTYSCLGWEKERRTRAEARELRREQEDRQAEREYQRRREAMLAGLPSAPVRHCGVPNAVHWNGAGADISLGVTWGRIEAGVITAGKITVRDPHYHLDDAGFEEGVMTKTMLRFCEDPGCEEERSGL